MIDAPNCECALAMPHVHKKADGYLLVRGSRGDRFLSWWEAVLWRIFHRLPAQ